MEWTTCAGALSSKVRCWSVRWNFAQRVLCSMSKISNIYLVGNQLFEQEPLYSFVSLCLVCSMWNGLVKHFGVDVARSQFVVIAPQMFRKTDVLWRPGELYWDKVRHGWFLIEQDPK